MCGGLAGVAPGRATPGRPPLCKTPHAQLYSKGGLGKIFENGYNRKSEQRVFQTFELFNKRCFKVVPQWQTVWEMSVPYAVRALKIIKKSLPLVYCIYYCHKRQIDDCFSLTNPTYIYTKNVNKFERD